MEKNISIPNGYSYRYFISFAIAFNVSEEKIKRWFKNKELISKRVDKYSKYRLYLKPRKVSKLTSAEHLIQFNKCYLSIEEASFIYQTKIHIMRRWIRWGEIDSILIDDEINIVHYN